MVKAHNVKLNITNHTAYVMTGKTNWFDSGRVADNWSWPQTISNGEDKTILCYEKNWSWAGCSGYVTYTMGGTDVTIGFSNPGNGTNKLGVGTNGKTVWDHISSHDYKSFVQTVTLQNGVGLNFVCKCSGGSTNVATVTVTQQ